MSDHSIDIFHAAVLISQAHRVEVQHTVATRCQLGEEGEPWLTLEWEDEGQVYSVEFPEEHNQQVTVHGNRMCLVDADGAPEWIKLLVPMELPLKGGYYTVLCRADDGSTDTIHITGCHADSATEAKNVCRQECIDDWNAESERGEGEEPPYSTSNVVVLGVIRGDIAVTEWYDGGGWS